MHVDRVCGQVADTTIQVSRRLNINMLLPGQCLGPVHPCFAILFSGEDNLDLYVKHPNFKS